MGYTNDDLVTIKVGKTFTYIFNVEDALRLIEIGFRGVKDKRIYAEILCNLVGVLLDPYSDAKAYVDTVSVVCNKLNNDTNTGVYYREEYVRDTCEIIYTHISDKITSFLPELGDERYYTNYSYKMVKTTHILISVDKNRYI